MKYKNKSYMGEGNMYHYSYVYNDLGVLEKIVRDKVSYYECGQLVTEKTIPVEVGIGHDSYGQFSYDLE